MGNAINNGGNSVSGNSQLSDMLARLASGKPVEDSGSESFARWMSQHQGAQAEGLKGLQGSQPTRPMPATSQTRPQASASLPNLAGSRLSASRASTPTAASAEPDRPTPAAGSRPEARGVKAKGDQAPKPGARPAAGQSAQAAEEGLASQRSDASTRTDLIGESGDEAVRFTTTLGEGVAEVKELTPPTDVQANDSASMMAWLVSLTQPGVAQPLPPEGSVNGDVSGEGVSTEDDAGLSLLGQDGDRGDKARGRGLLPGWNQGQRDLGLDTRASASLSAAALQVDALLGRAGAPTGQDTDALAAMLSADGARSAFGQTLSQVSAPRHEQATLPVPLDAPDFAQKLADQVSLWVGQVRQDGPMTAELHLNPAEMGPINVKISLDGTAAQIDFAAAAQETRQAIEASLSSLSTALNDVGLSLSGGGVSSQTPQQTLGQGGNPGQDGRAGRQADGRVRGEEGEPGDAGAMRQVSAPRPSRLGGLDLYA